MSENKKSFTLAQIAQHIGADIVGPFASSAPREDDYRQTLVSGLGSLGTASRGDLSHLSGASYRPLLAATQATAVILSAEDAPHCPAPSLVVSQPYLAFARASQLFDHSDRFAPGIHVSAVIASDAIIDEQAHIGAHVVIESGVRVAAHAIVQANTTIGQDSVIGPRSQIFPNVSVYPNVQLERAAPYTRVPCWVQMALALHPMNKVTSNPSLSLVACASATMYPSVRAR